MKIIFLDIDGVLNSFDNQDSLQEDFFARNGGDFIKKDTTINDGIFQDKHGIMFDQRCVRWLNTIVNETGAKIVLSSDWRHRGLDKIQQLWKDRNLPSEVIGITPHLAKGRSEEIAEFLYETDIKIGNIVILDDLKLLFTDNVFIHVDGEFGITGTIAQKAIEILNS